MSPSVRERERERPTCKIYKRKSVSSCVCWLSSSKETTGKRTTSEKRKKLRGEKREREILTHILCGKWEN